MVIRSSTYKIQARIPSGGGILLLGIEINYGKFCYEFIEYIV